MASFLTRELGLECQAGDDGFHIPVPKGKNDLKPRVILWNCEAKDKENCLVDYEANISSIPANNMVVFYNVPYGSGIEAECLAKGVRGFFYTKDPVEVIPKGLKTIINGELWVPRQVLSEFVSKQRLSPALTAFKETDKINDVLTEREREILSLIAVGATNGEIALELCISPHTVKTHIYNVFKKIGVPNRLQAALWAGKHL
ncbi:MAG: response regulator transcription factor [Thermodesulfobacteriota bacterium]